MTTATHGASGPGPFEGRVPARHPPPNPLGGPGGGAPRTFRGGRVGTFPFVGIDLTTGSRPSDLAALDLPGKTVAFRTPHRDDDVLAELRQLGGRIVAIDSPMGFPAGLCCLEETCPCTPTSPGTGRSAERALAERGISCFWTTKRTIIKGMIYRAIGLRERLLREGYEVLEVYPYAIKRILLGRQLPRKTTPAGLARLIEGAQAQLPRCRWPEPWKPTHDELDALYCTITARLYAQGNTDPWETRPRSPSLCRRSL